MCTVIKVKRKITDDPVDCLILECKKRKKLQSNFDTLAESLNEPQSESQDNKMNRIDSIKQILKYAGSAKNEVSGLGITIPLWSLAEFFNF